MSIKEGRKELGMQENVFKRRKVRDFLENIFCNIGTIILGAILFALIFVVIFMIKGKLHESRIVYASVVEARPSITKGNDKIDIEKEFYKVMASKEVEEAIKEEVAIDLPYEEFLEYVTISSKGKSLFISFEDEDEEYANLVVTKIFNKTAYEFMKEFPVDSFEIVKPATYTVDASNRDWTRRSIGWFILVGAALGGGLTFVTLCAFYLLDNTIKDEQDVREYLDIPVLSVIPVDKHTEDKKGGAL